MYINFAIGNYHDDVECGVVLMQACNILLGRPQQFDRDSMHHGRSNQYSFLYHDKKIVLHPMSLKIFCVLMLLKLPNPRVGVIKMPNLLARKLRSI